MDEAALDELLRSCIATACGADPASIVPGRTLRDLGLDSLSLVSVAALVESAAGITLDGEATARLLEAESIADLIRIFAGRALGNGGR